MSENVLEICTLDRSNVENRMKIFNAKNNSESLANLGVGAVLSVNNVYTTRGVRPQTGETCTNVYLFTVDGNSYYSQSRGIAQAIFDICELVDGDFLRNTKNGFATVKVVEIPTKNGVMKSLELLEV